MAKKSNIISEKQAQTARASPWRQLPLPSDPEQQAYAWDDTRLTETDKAQIQWHCGIEVHKRNNWLALYGILHDRPILGPVASFENSVEGRSQMVAFAQQFSLKRALMETTGIYHYTIGWAFERAFPKAQIVVMNARVIKHYLRRTRQNDRIDATNLAQLARYEELMEWSYLPTPHMAVQREYVRQRQKAVAEMVKIKNRIKKDLDMAGCGWDFDFHAQWQTDLIQAFCKSSCALGRFLGSQAASCWAGWLKKHPDMFEGWLDADPLPEARLQVIFLFQQLAVHQCELGAVESMIRSKVGADPLIEPQLRLILNAPGLGEFGVYEIITEIGRIGRFPNEKFFIAYTGIGPSGKTSGVHTWGDTKEQVVERDRPNPYKNGRLKRVLLAAGASIAKQARHGNSDDPIIRYARLLISRGLKGLKLVFKVAAKLGRCLFHCLAYGVAYQPNAPASRVPAKISRRKRETALKRALKTQAEDAWRSVQTITETLLRMGASTSTVESLAEQLKLTLSAPSSEGGR